LKNIIRIKNIKIGESEPVRLMAAINLSKESFYKKSIVEPANESELEQYFLQLIENGTEIFDLGPKSSAPINIYGGETQISFKEEIKRITVPLKILRNISENVIISIDTQSSKVAEFALSNGADIINDISGLKSDDNMNKILGEYNAFVVAMACKTIPGDVYKKEDVIKELQNSINIAGEYLPENHVIIDPGVGGWIPERTPDDDFQLILDTPEIKKQLQCPMLLALSRKSFIGKTLNLPPEERLAGSLSATAIGVLYEADIIRTHDIKETKEAILIAKKFLNILRK
jgi:dihydropteroate synthase